jgi:histidine phosphotransferase ChpT
MAFDQTELAALIGSRICHDLISPVGAINNGLELLAMSGTQDTPEMHLITESVENASARIRFFRIAFGAAGEQMVGHPEITSILRDIYGAGRLKVEWAMSEPQSRAHVRLSFLALMCLETAMPYGGIVVVDKKGDGWILRGSAEKLNIDPVLWALLSSQKPQSPVRPAQVQFALLPLVAKEDGRKLVSQASNRPFPRDQIFEAGQLHRPHRAACVHLAGGDANLCPHAKFAAIGKLGRGIMHQNRAVEFIHKARHRGSVFGKDAIGVV